MREYGHEDLGYGWQHPKLHPTLRKPLGAAGGTRPRPFNRSGGVVSPPTKAAFRPGDRATLCARGGALGSCLALVERSPGSRTDITYQEVPGRLTFKKYLKDIGLLWDSAQEAQRLGTLPDGDFERLARSAIEQLADILKCEWSKVSSLERVIEWLEAGHDIIHPRHSNLTLAWGIRWPINISNARSHAPLGHADTALSRSNKTRNSRQGAS